MINIDYFRPYYPKILIITFFSAALFLGVYIHTDYGISWDEPTSRKNGQYSFNYIFNKDNALLNYKDRDYGVAVELPLIILEKIFKLKDSRDMYQMRHLFIFLLFYVSLIFFYFIGKIYFKDWRIGLLGSIFLFISPRIFAHSFYNSKDLPLLSFYIISSFTLIRLINAKSISYAFWHGLTCALLIDTRIIGIILPFITTLFLAIGFMHTEPDADGSKKKNVFIFSLYIITLLGFVYLFWPYLWLHPIHNFVQAFVNMSSFRWNSAMLYMGRYINPPELPWHYLPVWMMITTPPLYSFLFIPGLAVCLKTVFSGTSIFNIKEEERNDLIILSLFFFPVVPVFILHPVLYDSWRHFFFVYPVFLLISLKGLQYIFHFIGQHTAGVFYRFSVILLIGAVCLQFIVTGYFMIKYHPFQNLYFSSFAGAGMPALKTKFEFDYWGLSYRQALEYLTQHDKKKNINIYAPNPMAEINADMLKPENRERLKFVTKLSDADYFMSNYRWHLEKPVVKNKQEITVYDSRNKAWLSVTFKDIDEFFSANIDGAKIVVVYKIDKTTLTYHMNRFN